MNPVTLGIAAVVAIGTLVIANWDDIKEAAGKLKDWVVDKLTALKDGAVSAFDSGMDAIGSSVKSGWEGAKTKFENFDTWLSGVFEKDWTDNFGLFGNVINGSSKTMSQKWESIKTIFSGVTTFLSGAFRGDWDKAWNGLKTVFEGVWQGFSATVKTPINAIIGFINGLLGGIQTMQNSIANALNSLPSLDLPGIGTIGFNIGYWTAPQIPYLAKGGIATKMTPAVIGEAGREAVLPLENQRTMKMISSAILDEMDLGTQESPFLENIALNTQKTGYWCESILRLAESWGLEAVRGMSGQISDTIKSCANTMREPLFQIINLIGGIWEKLAGGAKRWIFDIECFYFKNPRSDQCVCPINLATGGLITSPIFAHMGEMSKPEAVLPLTDNRAMSMIAESIYENAPAGGSFDEERLTDAIVEGVVTAMMNNAGNMRQDVNCYATLEIDGEVAARKLAKARSDRDYRMNTVGLAY